MARSGALAVIDVCARSPSSPARRVPILLEDADVDDLLTLFASEIEKRQEGLAQCSPVSPVGVVKG